MPTKFCKYGMIDKIFHKFCAFPNRFSFTVAALIINKMT